jgi:hypothetical protein
MITRAIRGHTFNVGIDWRNPNRIKAHLLDVVQVVNGASPRAATVVTGSCITWDSGSDAIVLVSKRKSICNNLRGKSGLCGCIQRTKNCPGK